MSDVDTQIGTVTVEGNHANLQYERRIAQPPEVVWKAIIDPKEVVIRWELVRDADNTLLTLMHRHLRRENGLRFAPGWHGFLDRLAAQLGGEKLPDLMERTAAVRGFYPG